MKVYEITVETLNVDRTPKSEVVSVFHNEEEARIAYDEINLVKHWIEGGFKLGKEIVSKSLDCSEYDVDGNQIDLTQENIYFEEFEGIDE